MSLQQRVSTVNVVRTLCARRRHPPRRTYYTARRGLTLVELLVVIVILTMVTAATIPLMSPATGEIKVRESARLLSTMLAQAQARALATGRPAGVWIERLSAKPNDDLANRSIDLFLCESPPPYSGESTSAGCRVGPPIAATTANTPPTARVSLFEDGQQVDLPDIRIRQGDLIQFNYRGHVYKIIGPADAEGKIIGRFFIIQPRHLSTNLPGKTPERTVIPYQIFRQPLKSADEPANLPVGAIVDLAYSGIGNETQFAVRTMPAANALVNAANGAPDKPVLIMFGPSGNLERVYYGYTTDGRVPGSVESVEPVTPVYLLIGQPPGDSGTAPLNFMNQANIWVGVNPQSGLVTASEVKIGPDYWQEVGVSNPQLSDFQAAIIESRRFARSAQNMGGR